MRDEIVDQPMEERGELSQVLGRPVRESHLHASAAHLSDALGRCQSGVGELDELSTAVVEILDADHVAVFFQLP